MTRLQRKLLKVARDFGPQGSGPTLRELRECAVDYCKAWSSPESEAYTDWTALRDDLQQAHVELLGFYPWGLFQESFQDRLRKKFAVGKVDTPIDCPLVGMKMLREIVKADGD